MSSKIAGKQRRPSPKPVVIFGAGGGIGGALALKLFNDGAEVHAVSRSTSQPQVSTNHVWAVGAPFSGALHQILSHNASTVLITAGSFSSAIGVTENRVTRLKQAFNDNVLLPLAIANEIMTCLAPKSEIIFFSGGGVGGNNHQKNAPEYVVAKTALVSLVEELSEQEPRSATILAVAPGPIPTGFTSGEPYDRSAMWEALAKDPNLDKLAQFCMFLRANEARHLSGKLIAPRWDFDVLNDYQPLPSNFGRLRRVVE